MEVNFYQIDDEIHKSIAPLLSKIIEDNKRALIYSDNQELIKKVDDGLWSFSKTKFLPHATIFENNNASKQPIFITNSKKNDNKADFLIAFDKVDVSFIEAFEKTFFFFDASQKIKARELWIEYKNQSIELSFYKKEDGAWIKVKL